MTPEELKKSIIQYAIQGKMNLSSPDDKPIVDEFSKRGISIKQVSDEDLDFELPKGWLCVYLNDIASFSGGYAFKSANYTKNGVRIIRISDFNEDGILNKDFKYYEDSSLLDDFVIRNKDILMCMTGGTVGKSCYVESVQEKMVINQRVAKISLYDFLCAKYVYYVLHSASIINEINKSKTSTNDNISMQTIKSFVIPLPPVEEQNRIVAKIEEFLPLLEKYEKSWDALNEFNEKFPLEMEKSILQMAMQGKLTTRSDNDSDVDQALKEIAKHRNNLIFQKAIKNDKRLDNKEPIDSENLISIPENWRWTYLGNLLYKLTDGTHQTPKYTEKGIKFVSVKDMSSGVLNLSDTKFISEEEHKELFKRCDPVKGDILLSKVGTTGVPAIIETDEQFSLFVSVALLKFNHAYIDQRFLYYLIKSPVVQKQAEENTRGVGNKNWVLDAIAKTIVPFPPLEEQKRIVMRLDELLPYCKKLQ